MATYYSQGSAPWSTLANWNTVVGGGGSSPASTAAMNNNSFVIQAGHNIVYDLDMSGFANGVGLTINGGVTPGTLASKYDAAGTYWLRIATALTLSGTTSTNRGRLLANSDGVWGNTEALPFDRKFIIDLKGTARIDAANLDIQLYDTEPANLSVASYRTKVTVTASASTGTLTRSSHGWANGTALMFRVTGGALPEPLTATGVYYVVSTATDTFKVAPVSGGDALDLTTDGSGTIEAYDGHASTSTATLNVLTDVTADPQWVSGAAVVLVNSNGTGNYDQQRVTISGAPTATTVTLSANVDSAQAPGAQIFLSTRNISIQSNSTTASLAMVDFGASTFTGAVLRCEIRNTAGTGTTFYGYGVNAGTGHTMSGVVSGCSIGILIGTGHTISGVVIGCSNGLNGGTGHMVSGVVSGCSNGLNGGTGHTVSGVVSGCNYGVSFGTGHTVSGVVSGCTYGVYSGTGHTVSGVVSGCNYGVSFGTGHTVSGVVSRCTYGVHSGTGHTVSGVVSGCSIGIYLGTGNTVSGVVSGCSNGLNGGTGHTVSGVVSGCSIGIYLGTGHTISGTVSGCSYVAYGGAEHIFSATCAISGNTNSLRISSSVDGPLNIRSRGASWSNLNIFGGNVSGDGRRGLYLEDYPSVGEHRAVLCTGSVIRDTDVTRPGGASSSMRVEPLSACAPDGMLPILEWLEYGVPAAAQNRAIYCLGRNWSVFPASTELWFEAEYLSAGTGAAKTLVKSSAVLTDNATWTQLGVSFTPAQAGIVRYRAYLAKYETDATHGCYISNELVGASTTGTWADGQTVQVPMAIIVVED